MSDIQVMKMTMAVVNMDEMVVFYNAVFDAELKSKNFGGTMFYQGRIGGIDALFCPNEIAGVVAEQNRHQFDYSVADLRAMVEVAVANGGELMGEIEESDEAVVASIVDPDGNTMVLVQNKFVPAASIL